MNYYNKLEKNLNKNFIYILLSNFHLTHGVWMLYLAYKGLNLFQIGIMESIFHITSFLMEIPTGMVADVYGRRVSRYTGRILAVVSTLIMLMANNVYLFALSFIFSALSYNLESGAGDALIYDSLKELDKESDYTKYKGRFEIFFQLASMGSLLVGGYLATRDYSLVYKLSLFIGIITIIQSFSFTEPRIGLAEREKTAYLTFLKQLKSSLNIVRENPVIAFVILFMNLFSTMFTTEFFYLQNYQKSIGNTELQIGLILAAGSLAAAFTASKAYKIEKRYPMKNILVFLSILSALCFWGMTIEKMMWLMFIFLSATESIIYIMVNNYLNSLIPSQQRATILSFDSMAFSFFMISFFPIFGKIGDVFGLAVSFRITATIATIILAVFVLMLIKNKKSRNIQ
jgi:MFS family permease